MIPRKQRLAAAKGLAFLEAKYPGCTDKFNLETLDISDRDHCALAQASGRSYGVAKHELDLLEVKAIEYGLISYAPTHVGALRVCKWLTAAYKELILERRAA